MSTIVRPMAAIIARPPAYRRSELHRAPSRCGNCGRRLILTEEPTAENRVVDVACLLCSRVACSIVWDNMPPRMTAERFAALPMQQGRRFVVHEDGTVVSRLLKHLTTRGADDAAGLAYHLNVSVSSVLNAIVKVRRAGHVITLRNGLYSLEGQP